ncbi:MAG: hypothetical protein LBT21_06290 [Oscillospiraceae bacterium]|jgi:hypothetical protein|nr:hypothetical protein [Oscillospiraceae bacterium]
MAKNTTNPTTGETQAIGGGVAKTVATPDAKKFPLATLREHCRSLLKVSTAYFDGAAAGLKGEYTVAEIRAKLAGWGKQKISKEEN